MNVKDLVPSKSLANPRYETLLSEAKAQLIGKIQQTCDSTFTTLSESDPMTKFLEVAVYREFLLWQQVDDAIKGSLLATATGENLAFLANLVLNTPISKVQALASPDTVRAQILSAWQQPFNTTGTGPAYAYYAKLADSRVVDVWAHDDDVSNSTVTLVVLAANHNQDISTIVNAVQAYLLQDDIHRIADQITVQPASILDYTIAATLKVQNNVNRSQLETVIKNKVQTYANQQYHLNASISLSKLWSAFYQQGVNQVTSLTVNGANKDLPTNASTAPCWTGTINFTYT